MNTKKILVFTSDMYGEEEAENINELGKRFQVNIAASLTLVRKLLKGSFDACVIEADALSMSPASKKLWLKFYRKMFKHLNTVLIFWSWSDEFREEIEDVGKNVFFVRKDGDKDNLLLAATDLLEE